MTDNKKKEELREKIRKCLIPADYHTELHDNIPVKSWTYTRDGIDFHVDQILSLCESIRAEALKEEDLQKLKDLREICIEDDLLDLEAYDSISRGDKIQNAWEALKVIERLAKLSKEEE